MFDKGLLPGAQKEERAEFPRDRLFDIISVINTVAEQFLDTAGHFFAVLEVDD